jgi:hypothetical protein
MGFLRIFAILAISGIAYSSESADDIMRKVAENQDRLQSERSDFVYDQDVRVISRRHNGKLICEQETEYVVTPKEKSSEHSLVWTKLKYWHDGHFVTSDKDVSDKDETIDTGIVKGFRDDLAHGDSKDGTKQDLFPLTTEQQKDLEFELTGERVVNGRPAYVIAFRPKDRKDFGWAGEAVIDKEEFEPVTVYTRMSRKIPFFVRTMLGTDVPGLGFTTQYTRVDKDLWFPSSFGTEFKIHAVYFFHRTVSLSMKNTNFRRANVDAKIHYGSAPN